MSAPYEDLPDCCCAGMEENKRLQRELADKTKKCDELERKSYLLAEVVKKIKSMGVVDFDDADKWIEALLK